MSYMTQNPWDKTNALPEMKNNAEYTMICIHYLIWGKVLEINNEIAKKIYAKKF